MYRMVNGFLGEDVLMYASDYSHSECQFPNSTDNILAWQSLKRQTQQKLFWDNANLLPPDVTLPRRDVGFVLQPLSSYDRRPDWGGRFRASDLLSTSAA
jgi:hypothetical protein